MVVELWATWAAFPDGFPPLPCADISAALRFQHPKKVMVLQGAVPVQSTVKGLFPVLYRMLFIFTYFQNPFVYSALLSPSERNCSIPLMISNVVLFGLVLFFHIHGENSLSCR